MFFGIGGYDPEFKTTAEDAYNRLKNSKAAHKAGSISFFDMIIISVVCNQMYFRKDINQKIPHWHVKKIQKCISNLNKQLEEIGETLKNNRRSDSYTVEGEDAQIGEAITVLMKLLFLVTEQTYHLKEHQHNQTTFGELIESHLNKSRIEHNFKVQPKPDEMEDT